MSYYKTVKTGTANKDEQEQNVKKQDNQIALQQSKEAETKTAQQQNDIHQPSTGMHPQQNTQPKAMQYDPTGDQAYQNAMAALQGAQTKMPVYQNSFETQLNDLYEQIVNRKPFQYNVNEDALYQQYADQYARNGNLAMQDTMAQAQAMTGGYGNSYAQQVGQQAYQGRMQQLNDRIPELYSLALDSYIREGNQLTDQYAMLGQRADDEYAKHQDQLNQYWQNVALHKELADDAYNRGYQQNRDSVADQQWKDTFGYQQERDDVADQQWQDSFAYQQDQDAQAYQQWLDTFGYQQERDAVADQQWQAEFDEAVRQWQLAWDAEHGLLVPSGGDDGGGSGGGGGGGGKPKEDDKGSGGSGLALDMDSVLDMGYGPISSDYLENLIASGQVNVNQNGNNITVEKNEQDAPTGGFGSGAFGSILPNLTPGSSTGSAQVGSGTKVDPFWYNQFI